MNQYLLFCRTLVIGMVDADERLTLNRCKIQLTQKLLGDKAMQECTKGSVALDEVNDLDSRKGCKMQG